MIPTQNGQIVRFHTPLPDEDPDQLFILLEYFSDVARPRAFIQALGSGMSIPPTTTVFAADLELVEFNTEQI
ncbi:MAG: hypothetical protein WAU11_02135 [Ignavibacteriaceae bacterium]|jgi:hypothetical protein